MGKIKHKVKGRIHKCHSIIGVPCFIHNVTLYTFIWSFPSENLSISSVVYWILKIQMENVKILHFLRYFNSHRSLKFLTKWIGHETERSLICNFLIANICLLGVEKLKIYGEKKQIVTSFRKFIKKPSKLKRHGCC